MGYKATTVLVVHLLEFTDRVLCFVDYLQRSQLVEQPIKRIVRSVPHVLQCDERFREFPDSMWKFLQRALVPASASCASVFKGAVHLMPSLATTTANEQVGSIACQRMEHGEIRRADRATQVGLCMPSRIKLRQIACRGYQVVGFHVSSYSGHGWHKKYTGNQPSESCTGFSVRPQFLSRACSAVSGIVRDRIRSGKTYSGKDFAQAWQKLEGLRAEFRSAAAGFDAVAIPTSPIRPPARRRLLSDRACYGRNNRLAGRNTRIANLMELPALTLPTGVPSVGAMLLGKPFEEAKLLRLGKALEAGLAG